MKTLEDDLRAYYRSSRIPVDPSAKAAAVDSAVREWGAVQESKASRREMGYVAFVAEQARFMGARVWLLQAFVVAFVALAAWADPSKVGGLFACLAGAAVALCGMPDVLASRMCGLMELERSCKFNARSVASARMVVLACANAAALFASSCLIAEGGELALSVVQVFAPYFVTVGGCLVAARRMRASGALVASMAWASLVVSGAYVAASRFFWIYETASWWIWALAAAVAIVWVLFETRRWLADVRFSSGALAFDSVYVNR